MIPMKRKTTLRTVFALILCSAIYVNAGTLSYLEIPASGSDAGSLMSQDGIYTAAVYGNLNGGQSTINGVPISPLTGAGSTLAANHIEVSSAEGTLSSVTTIDPPQGDGNLSSALTAAVSNVGAPNNSEQYVVLDSSNLVAGKTYDFRIYIRKGGSENRLVNLTFAGDGQAPVMTDFFNEDDATTSPGGFEESKQIYAINYRFKWDGVTTPGVTVSQKFGGSPFIFYAATNQEAVEKNQVPVTEPSSNLQAVAPVNSNGVQGIQKSVVIHKAMDDSQTDVGVASDEFYNAESLNTNGEWVSTSRYGNCWRPTAVSEDWGPYTDGYWRHSENDGWIWISNEPWGWATYHYGRWIHERHSGWIWIPGRKWAPAWVSWRYGGSYTGWAPLPPDAVFDNQIGINASVDTDYDLGPDHYNFVRVHDFGSERLHGFIIPRSENVIIIQNTNNITHIVHRQNSIYNGGPNYNAVNSIIRKHGGDIIPEVQINRNGTHGPGPHDGKFSQMNGNTLTLSAPTISSNGQNVPHHIKPIQSGEFDKGWSGVKDPAVVSNLKTKMGNETRNGTHQNTITTGSETIPKNGTHNPTGIQQGQTAGQPVNPQQGIQTSGFHRPGSLNQSTGQMTGQPANTQQGTQTSGSHRPGSLIQSTGQMTGQPANNQQGIPSQTPGIHQQGSQNRSTGQTAGQSGALGVQPVQQHSTSSQTTQQRSSELQPVQQHSTSSQTTQRRSSESQPVQQHVAAPQPVQQSNTGKGKPTPSPVAH